MTTPAPEPRPHPGVYPEPQPIDPGQDEEPIPLILPPDITIPLPPRAPVSQPTEPATAS